MLIADTKEFLLFCMILMRMSGFVLLNPVFGRRSIPSLFKTGFVMVLTVLIYFAQRYDVNTIQNDLYPLEFGIILVKEFLVGFFIGYIMILFEYVITYAGAIMDFQMGLSMATVYDAQNGAQIALTGQILQIYYTLLFFAVDGHLAITKILITSSDILPYGKVLIGQFQSDVIVNIFIECTVLAVKLAFPLIAIEFLTEIAVGMLMKIIPQINLFVLNIELKVIVGILVLVFLISPIGDFLNTLVTQMVSRVQDVLLVLAG